MSRTAAPTALARREPTARPARAQRHLFAPFLSRPAAAERFARALLAEGLPPDDVLELVLAWGERQPRRVSRETIRRAVARATRAPEAA